MKLMHFADLHLDTPFYGVKTQAQDIHDQLVQAPYQAFQKGIDYCIDQEIDLVVISGDIYDAQHPTIYAQMFFSNQLLRLQEAQIPVVYCHGNHDYLQETIVEKSDQSMIYRFDHERVTHFDVPLRNNQVARVYGFSYHHQWVDKNMAKEFPKNNYETDYTIGVYHGALATHTNQDHYAPFNIDDLTRLQYDYIALGHIHSAITLSEHPSIHYSGTTQGRHQNESGDKGALRVTISSNQCHTEFIPLAPIRYETIEIEYYHTMTIDQLMRDIQKHLTRFDQLAEKSNQSYLLTFSILHSERMSGIDREQIKDGEWRSVLTNSHETNYFVYVLNIHLQENAQVDLFAYDSSLKTSYYEAQQFLLEDEQYQLAMAPLFNHARVKQWLPHLKGDPLFKEQVFQQAWDTLANHLSHDGQEVN